MPGTELYKNITYVDDIDSFWDMNCSKCKKIANSSIF